MDRAAHIDTTGQIDLEKLTPDECRRLLATQSIGRIGVVADGEPMVMPVNFALDGDDIVFRTTTGSSFDRMVRGASACFEIDAADPAYHTGWSVLARGRVRVAADASAIARYRLLPLRPWARGECSAFLALHVEALSGRRIAQVNRPVPAQPVIDLTDAQVYWG
jgi:uncharacterized protein